MTTTTQLQSESKMPTTQTRQIERIEAPTTATPNNVLALPEPAKAIVPDGFLSVEEFVQNFESRPADAAGLIAGRHWVASTFYDADGETVRALRLKKGWSQNQLADALQTSQSHVARIERGTENVQISTARKLSAALEIDMNSLDECLRRQEQIATNRAATR
jgi:DNA-binding XRE family transcriptional regulator